MATLRCTLNSSRTPAHRGSLMAVDNSNGEVLAMVGGRDYNLSQFKPRHAGGAAGGFVIQAYVYTTAVEAGAKPTDLIVDGPTTFSTPGGPYTPHNYEGDYKGTMTLLNAFAESRNIPALKLADRVGHRQGGGHGASLRRDQSGCRSFSPSPLVRRT